MWFECRVLGVQSEKGKEVAGIRQDRAWPSKTPLQDWEMVGPTLPPNNADTGRWVQTHTLQEFSLWTPNHSAQAVSPPFSWGLCGHPGVLPQWAASSPATLFLLRLQTGWSVHTYQTEKQRRNQCLSPAELEVILQVIQRAERLDILEQQRIG